jgi:serine/threonine protein kinase
MDDSLRALLGEPGHPELLGRLGRYDIERVIGSGGMGIVLKAHDSELNRPIAIKVLAGHLAHVGAARERFAREGRAAAAVVHEHVVAIYNVESDGAVPFLVMQYVPGRSLQARVDEDGPLAATEALRIGVQAAAGLAAAHRQGLVHRDVKPSNILLEDTVERAVLTDFGLARAMDDASLTQTGIVAGTPHYMSPEQATGGQIDHRSDLFSLGSVLYFMVAGRPPFRATGSLAVLHRICHEPHRPAWQVKPEIPDELCDVIDRLLEKKPSRRFTSAEEVRDRLAALLNQAQTRGLGRRRLRKLRGRRTRRMAAVVGAIALGGIGAWAALSAPSHVEDPLERAPRENPITDRAAASPTAVEETSITVATSADSSIATTEQLAIPFDPGTVQQLADGEQHFAAELAASRASADALGKSQFMELQNDEWRNEIDAIERELNRLELMNDR